MCSKSKPEALAASEDRFLIATRLGDVLIYNDDNRTVWINDKTVVEIRTISSLGTNKAQLFAKLFFLFRFHIYVYATRLSLRLFDMV